MIFRLQRLLTGQLFVFCEEWIQQQNYTGKFAPCTTSVTSGPERPGQVLSPLSGRFLLLEIQDASQCVSRVVDQEGTKTQ